MEVVNINKDKQKSEHDQMWKGKPVNLDIISYHNGVVAVYLMDVTMSPMPGLEIPHRHALAKVFVKTRWWDSWFGRDEEWRVDKAVRLLKERWEDMKTNTNKFDSILEKYGVNQDAPE